MDIFACGQIDKVNEMTDFSRNDWLKNLQHDFSPDIDNLTADEDLLMEQILDNMNTTPIGQVLKKIASLPEVSQKKVINVRRQLVEGKYDLNERLDQALEKVLEDLNV